MANKDATYYERMQSSASNKIDSIRDFVKQGTRVLDFGSGLNTDVADFVTQEGGYYVSVDSELGVHNFLTERGIECHLSLEEVQGQFNLVFLSSVMHEVFSFNSPIDVAHLIRDLSALVAEGGMVVIRDWWIPTLMDDCLSEPMLLELQEIKVEEELSPSDEVQTWLDKLKANGIISNMASICKTRDEKMALLGLRRDIYEIFFHCVWGLKSLERESRERYIVDRAQITSLFAVNGVEVEKIENFFDDDYKVYAGRLFKYPVLPGPSKSLVILKKTQL